MNIEEVLTNLKIVEQNKILEPYWNESLETYNSKSNRILNDDILLSNISRFCDLTEADVSKIKKCAILIEQSYELNFLFYHIFQLIFIKDDFDKQNYKNLPTFEMLGELSETFYILLILQLFVNIHKFHKNKNISDTISKETLFDLKININRYDRGNDGKFGISVSVLGWFKTHSSCLLYKIGRLQFLHKKIGDNIKVYRNINNNKIVTFSKENIIYTKDGFWPVAEKENDLLTNWVSVLNENDNSISGNPITPDGYALKEVVTLNLSEWENVLKEGDEVLDIHIPEGGKMTVEACISSMKKAVAFYKQYFPNKKIKAFTCRSWIFSPQYDKIYNPNANFVKFQKEVYLFPVWSSGKEGVYFIFDTETIDLNTIEIKNSLQKAMVSHLKSGGVLRAGGMFFLTDDIDKLGTQLYLKGVE